MRSSPLFLLFFFLLRWRKRVRDKYTKLLTKDEADFFKVFLHALAVFPRTFYPNPRFRL